MASAKTKETYKLDRVLLRNFKSYAGDQEIGPFSTFSSIVGPNGAGKSNILDAICFVFCLDMQAIRIKSFSQLVHTGPSHTGESTFVRVIFSSSEGEELAFEREIVIKDTDTDGVKDATTIDRVDGTRLKLSDYVLNLKEIGIDPEAKNFLVQQNEILHVARQDPMQLCALFERVSGSMKLKGQYEEKKRIKRQAEEKHAEEAEQRSALAKRKGAIKAQKEEAEKYQQCQKEQNEAMLFGYMARIKQITSSESECRSKLDDFKEKQEAQVAKQEDLDRELNSFKKQKAVAQKQLVASEKEVEKFSSQLADLDRTKHESQSQNTVNRRKLDDADKRSKKSASALKQIKDQIAKKRIEIEGLRSHLGSVSSSKSSDISEADRERLAQLKHELAVRSKEVEEGLNKAQSSKKSLSNSVQHLVDHDLPMLQRKLDDYNSKVLADAESANTDEYFAQKTLLENELEALGQSIRKDEQQLKKLEEKLSEDSDKLGKVKGHMKQKQQEEEFVKLLVSLKEQFGDENVLGRVMDLCQPRNPQHSLAVFAAMQSHMDSIVVRNIDVAERCIEHIKERKVSPKVFLPLNTIKPSAPSVDGIPRGIIVRPLIDLVEILVPQADIAVKFACGKTLFIESRDDAARVVGKKIVSLDGTVFSKSGAMQGGTTNSLSSRAESWKDAEASANAAKFKAAVEDTKAAKSALAKKVSDSKARKEAVSLNLTRVVSQISMAEKRKIEADISGKQLKASRAYAEKDLARKQEDLKKAEASIAQLECTIQELSAQKDTLRKEVLGSFMKKLGKNIDEYDDLVKSYAEVQQKRNDIQKQMTAGEGELKRLLVSEKKYNEEAESTAKERAQIEAKIVEFDSKKKERETMDASLRQKIKDSEKVTVEAKSSLSQVDERLHKTKSVLDGVVSQLSEQKEAMMKLQRELDSISGRLADIEGDATTNGVAIPKLKNGTYDFSVLPRAATSTSSKDALNKFIEDSSARLVKVSAALEQLRPNFRYQEHMTTLEKELQDQNRRFEASLESSRKAAGAFEEVKKRRCVLLRDFVMQVKDALNVTYGQLTSDDVHKDGGSAFLLDPDEEPYETGIRFEAIPPGKGYSSIDTLAGGEKSIAAIALLFAMHSVRPAPFIILDEVDSALDNRNLQRFTRFIERHAAQNQIIAISHREKFYDKSDILVGVAREVEEQTSISLTLDLGQYNDGISA